MNFNESTRQFFNQKCFSQPFPGYDRSLTGSGVAALLGLCRWETVDELRERLRLQDHERVVTWEMERGKQWKPNVAQLVESGSSAYIARHNPFTGRKLYVCDNLHPASGGLADGFFINRKSCEVTAGLTIKTSGLSSAGFWYKRIPEDIAAQNLFYMGLCGDIQWVVSVMFFCTGEDGLESEPWEIRSFRMMPDKNLSQDILEEVRRFWDTKTQRDETRIEDIRNRVKKYAATIKMARLTLSERI